MSKCGKCWTVRFVDASLSDLKLILVYPLRLYHFCICRQHKGPNHASSCTVCPFCVVMTGIGPFIGRAFPYWYSIFNITVDWWCVSVSGPFNFCGYSLYRGGFSAVVLFYTTDSSMSSAGTFFLHQLGHTEL